MRCLPKLVPQLQKHGQAVVSGRWDDNIGYLAIASWDKTQLNDGRDVFAALDRLRDATALVIDVRANGGGAEPLAQQLAGCFVNERRCMPSTSPAIRRLRAASRRPANDGWNRTHSGPISAAASPC